MKTNSLWTLAKIALGLAMILGACWELETFRRREKAEPGPEVIRPVKTVRLSGAPGGSGSEYFGFIQGARRVNLSFRVPGTLAELPAEKGASVEKGALLARLDPRDFRTQLAQAESRQAQARAQYGEAESNFKRYSALYQQKVIASAQFDAYQTRLNVARAALNAAAAQTAAARDALKDTELRAPFDGVVADRLVENFQDVTAKQTIVSFQDLSTLEIVFDVPDKDVLRAPVPVSADAKELARLRGDFRLAARFDAVPGRSFPVQLKEFAAQADPQTGTYAVTVTMPQPEGVRALPGMSVTVSADLGGSKRDGWFSVPATAVLSEGKENAFLWRYQDGQVEKISVQVGQPGAKGTLEVRSAKLHGGELIVIYGVHFLHDGQKVRLMDEGL